MKNILLLISVITIFFAACNTKPTEPTAEQIQAKKDSIEKAAADSIKKAKFLKELEDEANAELAALNAEEKKLKEETDKLPADKKAKADKNWREIIKLLNEKNKASEKEIDSLKKEIESLTKK